MQRAALGAACVAALLCGGAQAQQAAPAEPSAAETRVVAGVDFAGLRPETMERLDALTLEQRVILRLLQEGFAVAAPYAQPDVLLKLEDLPAGVRLVAEALGARETTDVALTTGSRAELQLEVAQRIVDLARSRASAVLADRAARSGDPEPRLVPLRPQPRPWTPDPIPPRVHVRASLSGEALWRGPGVDPLARLTVGVEPPGIFSVDLSVAYAPSGTPAAEPGAAPLLSIRDYHVQLGPRVRLVDAGRWRTDVGLLTGVMFHQFEFSPAVPRPDPDDAPRLDFLLSFPVELRYELTDVFAVGLRLAPGLGRAREHKAEAQVEYRRDYGRLEAGLLTSVLF